MDTETIKILMIILMGIGAVIVGYYYSLFKSQYNDWFIKGRKKFEADVWKKINTTNLNEWDKQLKVSETMNKYDYAFYHPILSFPIAVIFRFFRLSFFDAGNYASKKTSNIKTAQNYDENL